MCLRTLCNKKTCLAIIAILLCSFALFVCHKNNVAPEKQFSNSNDNYSSNMEDIVICMRTSSQYRERLTSLLKTWLPQAMQSLYIITDFYDKRALSKEFETRWVITKCKSTHRRKDQCCKMEAELDLFISSHKKWLCHVDDDTYINIPALARLLTFYDNRRDLYIGKPSVPKTLLKDVTFQFATGGAGFCLSQSLALKMSSYVLNNKFVKLCGKLFLPDDCTLGYIINYLLHVNLTVIPLFHSHLEDLTIINSEMLQNEISFSYSNKNVVSVDGFSQESDPSRFLSIHCYLYPNSKECLHLKSYMKFIN